MVRVELPECSAHERLVCDHVLWLALVAVHPCSQAFHGGWIILLLLRKHCQQVGSSVQDNQDNELCLSIVHIRKVHEH